MPDRAAPQAGRNDILTGFKQAPGPGNPANSGFPGWKGTEENGRDKNCIKFNEYFVRSVKKKKREVQR